MILDTFPSAEEFYKTYWGKKPFIVREFIPPALIDNLVDGDTLAGLALEEGIRSRIITNSAEGNDWVCEHGPFEEDRFGELGEQNWSLLVQNVEQYHTETAALLPYFQCSPRWLMDDIMVSYSAPGGSVGPHTDSYHTFLVQGIGKRSWKISTNRVDDNRYIDNQDMKILRHGFEGETFEVTAGDIIYMPPFFGHEGKTVEAAMTFSIGFLGPKLSEMIGDYAHYLEERDELNKRYLGQDLDVNSAGFTLAQTTQNIIQGHIVTSLQSDDFAQWMAAYFSAPSHEDIEDTDLPQNNLQGHETLYKPEHIKLVITHSQSGLYLAVSGEVLPISVTQKSLIEQLVSGQDIDLATLKKSTDPDEDIAILNTLYQGNFLSIKR